MSPDTVSFTGFEEPFRASKLRAKQPANAPSFWPEEWMIVLEKTAEGRPVGDTSKYYKWISLNCKSQVEIARDNASGIRVFAFEDDEEAMLFKFSF